MEVVLIRNHRGSWKWMKVPVRELNVGPPYSKLKKMYFNEFYHTASKLNRYSNVRNCIQYL
jgi:hypothetical protein